MAGNLAFQGMTRLQERLALEDPGSSEASFTWKCDESSSQSCLPHRTSMTSTTYTESELTRKLSIDLIPSSDKPLLFPTGRLASHIKWPVRQPEDVFELLSTQDLAKAVSNQKSLQDLVECLDNEIENICLRDMRKPLRKLKCMVDFPEASTLMRRRSGVDSCMS